MELERAIALVTRFFYICDRQQQCLLNFLPHSRRYITTATEAIYQQFIRNENLITSAMYHKKMSEYE
ncbi:hypothetical protein [Microcoleus sp. Pol8_D6]|uniref:hypothetical protein n=1 Tax=Microcoleus sp. Pol8_D6 TaxID=2818899 RepID=UPI002FD33EF9